MMARNWYAVPQVDDIIKLAPGSVAFVLATIADAVEGFGQPAWHLIIPLLTYDYFKFELQKSI